MINLMDLLNAILFKLDVAMLWLLCIYYISDAVTLKNYFCFKLMHIIYFMKKKFLTPYCLNSIFAVFRGIA